MPPPAVPKPPPLPGSTPQPLQLTESLKGSHNRNVARIGELVKRYNLLLPTFLLQRRNNPRNVLDRTGTVLLDRMAFAGLTYLAAKPPSIRKPGGQRKWREMADFLGQLQAHAAHFGIKMLHSDSFNGREGVSYWLERLDPRMNALDRWEEFTLWAQCMKTAVAYGGMEASDLEYLDEVARERYRIALIEGKACYAWDKLPLDTSAGRGTYSGRNHVFIYVCSARTQQFHSFAAKESVMHHSSFLSGEPVLGAGDWLAEDGAILYVNGESGHYRPSFDNMRTMALAGRSIWHPRAIVQPWFDRPDAYVTMNNLVLLGARAPLIRASDPMLVELRNRLGDGERATFPAFRHREAPAAAAPPEGAASYMRAGGADRGNYVNRA